MEEEAKASQGAVSKVMCKVTPVILHGVVSGDTTPYRMTGVTLHGVVSPERSTSATLPLVADSGLVGSEGYRERRSCSRDGYLEIPPSILGYEESTRVQDGNIWSSSSV